MRKVLILSLIAGLSFLLGFTLNYHIPRIKTWLALEIEAQTREHLPVGILPETISLTVFPIGLQLDNIRVVPVKGHQFPFQHLSIGSVNVNLAFIPLFLGQLEASEVIISKLKTKLDIAPFLKESETPWSLTQKKFSSLLKLIPIQQFLLLDSELFFKDSNTNRFLNLYKIHLSLKKDEDALKLRSAIPIVETTYDSNPLIFSTKVVAQLRQDTLNLSQFQVAYKNSSATLSGRVSDFFPLPTTKPKMTFSLKTDLQLPEMSLLARKVLKKENFPNIKGHLQSNILYNTQRANEVDTQAIATNISINEYIVGDFDLNSTLSKEQVHLKEFNILSTSGKATVSDFILSLGEKMTFTSQLNLKKFDLHALLENLDVGNVPVYLGANGNLPCNGSFKPKFEIICTGKANGEYLNVYSEATKSFEVVALGGFEADGFVKINDQSVMYQADLTIGRSTGSSQGTIDYEKGFFISYKGDDVRFSDLKNLANLKFEGRGEIQGSTQGNSSTATIDMKIKTSDFWFEDYQIGAAQTRLRYAKGNLSFQRLKGSLGRSRYQGQVDINLRKSELAININSPFIDALDIQSAVSRQFFLPFDILGSGTGNVQVWGPFQLNRLSYNIDSTFFRGAIAKESYDRVVLKAKSRKGNFKIDQVELFKSNSRIFVTGTVSPEGQMNVHMKGIDLELSESEHISRTKQNISGLFNFNMTLQETLLSPTVELQGSLKNLFFANSVHRDSNFDLKIDKEKIKGSASLIGDQIVSDFQIPFKEDIPFKFNFESSDLDFAKILLLIDPDQDVRSRLSTKMSLKSQRGGFWNSTGSVTVNDFFFQKDKHYLENKNPLQVHFKNGVIQLKNFSVAGKDDFVKVQGRNISKDNLSVNINGKTRLDFLTAFAPFVEELHGTSSFSIKMAGTSRSPEILGSIFVENGHIRVKEFPHPLSEIRADLLLSQNTLTLNSLHAQLNGGRVLGEGSLDFQGFQKLPANFTAQLDNVTLNIPEGIQTKGTGQLALKGNWFPYTLSGQYNISSGTASKEFGSDSDSESQVKQSTFLPKLISKSAFNPLNLDLKVDIKRDLKVKNSLFEGEVDGQLHITGSPESPLIQGQLKARKDDRIFYRDLVFNLSSLNLKFSDPNEINPELFISAQSRVEEYDINLLVQGTSKAPSVRLSSEPSLPEQEIISLLAFGFTSENLEQDSASADDSIYQTLLIQRASDLLKKNAFGGIKEKTGVEVTVGAEMNDIENTAVPVITLKKQFTPKFGVAVSRHVFSTDVNAKSQYRLNKNVFIVGNWRKETEKSNTTGTDSESPSIFGLDLEYKVEFR